MHIVYINPNSTRSMTEEIVTVARSWVPQARVTGLTNHDGPPAIQGAEDGAAAVPGVLARVAQAKEMGADAIVIACFDDTGLEQAQAAADCPVLGIGQSAYTMAQLQGGPFAVVTSLAVSVPVIEDNIARAGFGPSCAGVRASGLPVLEIEKGTEATRALLADAIRAAQAETSCRSVILGCAGMAPLLEDLAARTNVALFDGVAASARLAVAMVGGKPVGHAHLVEQAKQVVEDYLRLSMIPDPEAAVRLTAPGFRVTFTGGRKFCSPAETTAFNQKRYALVKKRFGRTDAVYDPSDNTVRVFNTGHLYGEWPDGTPFDHNRYIDIFTVRGGLIEETQVWNDSAELLLYRHELSEYPIDTNPP